MSALSRVLHVVDDSHVAFDCPGCGFAHIVHHGSGPHPVWTYNGNAERPTFSPSIRVTWTQGPERIAQCCHSFVRDGQIEFCGDCTHALAGKTVPLPDFDHEGWE